jgi:UPF0755 protein
MKKKYLILLILIIGVFFGTTYWMIYSPQNPAVKGEIVFIIKRGEGSREIAQNLENQGLTRGAFLFRSYALISRVSGRLQAGTYLLSPSTMNIPAIVKKFSSGDIAKVKITIPEGFTAEQIYQKLMNITNVNLSELEEKEGFLFPDTYEIPYGAESEDVIKIMTDNFNKKITPDLKEEIDRQGKKLEDIVIMASLIEKEVRTKEDKELVSGILWKRLKNDMPLQVDAEMGTYEYLGLPPAPICNPGLESIIAAIYPEDSQYWYYLSTPEGETIFSKTLKEHNEARAKYLK